MLRDILLVFIGGGAGCVGRYGISLWIKRFSENLQGFPVHTFVANIVGCLIIGLLMGFLSKHPNQMVSMLLVTGFCGGFTTFSTFSLEGFNLIKTGQYGMATLYIVLSLCVCLISIGLGLLLAKFIES